MSGIEVEDLGDQALLLRWGRTPDLDSNRRVHQLAGLLRAQAPPWLRDVVPAFASLALFVDTDVLADADAPLQQVRAWLSPLLAALPMETVAETGVICEIPVCYEGEFAPDLEAVARAAGCDREEAIRRHLAGDYRVAMLGFAAGFPYLLGLDATLAMPRLATPRVRVPAGSVGIGGAQTGIYPSESPGGWQLIGRTPLRLFDAYRQPPALLAPGQRLRFLRIGAEEFTRLGHPP